MRLTLSHTGLLPRFEGRRFSIDQVAQGKPAPDLFLLAARTFDVAPARCCVIEDTPTGTTAGVTAGMRVYGYCALTPAQLMTSAGAHRTFTSMSELPALILIIPDDAVLPHRLRSAPNRGHEARGHVVGDAGDFLIRIAAAKGRHVARIARDVSRTTMDDDLRHVDGRRIVDRARTGQ